MTKYYFGEVECNGFLKNSKKCQRKAYYLFDNQPRCGYHSNKNSRIKLKVNPNAEALKREKLKRHLETLKLVAAENRKLKLKGKIKCTKLKMFQAPALIEGYLNVFPNNKHQNRKDGFGCSSLSPMRLGPVDHGQPGLPPALNLENFHQGNKCFKEELEKDAKKVFEQDNLNTIPNPSKRFFETQLKIYNDPIPHRHKAEARKITKGNKNIPVYSVWKRKDSSIKKCSYIESRQFYCTFYQRLAIQTQDFKTLVKMINDGYNLNIVGYDAFEVTDIGKHYLDPDRPFGHELVLYTLLATDEKEYPWLKYKTEEF